MNLQNDYDQEYFEGIYARLAKEKKYILAAFLNLLWQRASKIKKILDLGCGEGEFLQLCQKKGIASFGVDVSDFALSKARDVKAKFFKLDLNKDKLPFSENEFEAVTCFDLLEHLASPSIVLSQAYRVLKPDGVFFMTTPNGQTWLKDFLGLFFPSDKTHINVRGARYWQGELEEAGFSQIQVKGCFLFGFPPGLDFRYLLRKLKLPSIYKPLFSPILPVASTLFIFATKRPRS